MNATSVSYGRGSKRHIGTSFDLGALNPQQREAVLHEEGPLLVLAGAGSGKTRVITTRIARLIRDGTKPQKILGVTFTNKAAGEMRERVAAMVGNASASVQLSTFHALGLTILKAEPQAAGLHRGFVIYDTSDQISLVRELQRRTKVADRRLDVSRVLNLILETKRLGRSEVEIQYGDDYEFAAYELYTKYVEQMRALHAVDFDDLLLLSLQCLRQPEVGARWSNRFEHILVDEYQDTSPDQLELLQILAGDLQNVCAVGDDDQSIYSWRGADARNIARFSKSFPGAREIILDQNYRSTNHILQAANAVIANNTHRKPKNLWSALGDGHPVHLEACEDGELECEFVCDQIRSLLYEGAKPSDIAVLYRSNVQSRAFEETLALENIPHRVVGGQSFFERKEVRDAIAFLAVAQNPYDEIALRRIINVPARGVGATTLQRLAQHATRNGISLWEACARVQEVSDLPRNAQRGLQDFMGVMRPMAKQLREATAAQLAPVARQLFDAIKLRDSILNDDDAPKVAARRLENHDEVFNALSMFARRSPAGTLLDFLRHASLIRQDENDDQAPSEVTLMTLHGAKGLEFPYVFLVGLEDELLPHQRTLELGGDLAEERRLFYVGMTRAQRCLWLVRAMWRRKRGKLVPRTPSRFLQELPEEASICATQKEPGSDTQSSDDKANEFFARMREQFS